MKNSRVLLIIFASILLLIPTASATRSPAVSITLTPGITSLIGTVDVSNLQETGQSTTDTNQATLHSQGVQAYAQGKAQVGQNGYVPTGEATKTITTAPSTPTPHTTTVGLVLEGAPGGSPNPCGCSPPDVIVGAGPNHVFEMVNLAGIIYTKSGTVARATFGLDTFFNLPASSMSDPQVSYDASSGRWFASIIDIPNARVVFAVSTSSDPTGTFNLYSVSDAGHLPDQPVTGTNNDKYVISVNDFDSSGTSYVGVHYWVLNKSELTAGATTIHFATNTPDGNMFSLHPAQHLSSSTTFYMVTDCTGSCIPSPTSQTNTETVVSITGLPPAAVTVSSSSFSIATSVIGPNAAQPGGTALTTNDNRVESVVWESNSLWASWNDACIPSGDTATRTCLRLVQATTSGATATKAQDFDFSASGQYYFYPAVSSYQGQLVVSFGRSSSSIYPSAMATGRASSDPVSTLQAPAVIRAGTTADTSTRYGDYFGAATDPTPTAASTFWVAGEYRKSTTFQNWNTVIAQIAAFSAPGTFDFSVSLNPTSGSVVRGSGTTSTVTVSLVSGTPSSVALSASVSPTATGLTVGVSPTSGTPTYTSTLTVSTTTSTPTGSYTVTVTGTSGTLSHSATYALTVTALASPDFSISVSPSSVTVRQGSSGTSTVTLSSLNGFSGTITLSRSAPPSGTTIAFNPTTVTLASGGTGTSTVTFTASATATTGTFAITITGTSGSLTHSATVSLTVTTTAPPDFSISASPTSVTILQGTSGTSTITLTSLNGFSGTITLSRSTPPSGTTAAFNPVTITLVSGGTGTSTITFTASGNATTGTFTITITGTSGTLTHTTTITLTVNVNNNCNNC